MISYVFDDGFPANNWGFFWQCTRCGVRAFGMASGLSSRGHIIVIDRSQIYLLVGCAVLCNDREHVIPNLVLQSLSNVIWYECRNWEDNGQGFYASWKVLDFFPKISRTWKVLENEFGPGKSWELKFKVLESPGINSWFNLANMPFMYRTPCVNNCMKYSCYVL